MASSLVTITACRVLPRAAGGSGGFSNNNKRLAMSQQLAHNHRTTIIKSRNTFVTTITTAASSAPASSSSSSSSSPDDPAAASSDAPVPPPPPCELVKASVKRAAESNHFVVSKEEVERLMLERGVADVQSILPEFVNATQAYARPPTSRFYVGAAALGSTGAVYLGVNVEMQARWMCAPLPFTHTHTHTHTPHITHQPLHHSHSSVFLFLFPSISIQSSRKTNI